MVKCVPVRVYLSQSCEFVCGFFLSSHSKFTDVYFGARNEMNLFLSKKTIQNNSSDFRLIYFIAFLYD